MPVVSPVTPRFIARREAEEVSQPVNKRVKFKTQASADEISKMIPRYGSRMMTRARAMIFRIPFQLSLQNRYHFRVFGMV